VEESDIRDWFTEYLRAFAALGRGESRLADVVAYYGVPFLLTTVTYIITRESEGFRISALLLHSP